MLAAVFHGQNDLRLERRPDPEAGPGEVVLKIDSTSLCGTDMMILAGRRPTSVQPPVVLGHEIAGRIAQIGEGVKGYQIGQQATVSVVIACHRCGACVEGLEHLCVHRERIGFTLDGGLAEYLLVPARAVGSGNLLVPPRELPSQALALADPLSCVINAHNQVGIQPGETVVVMGAGPMGLMHVLMAARAGATQIIVTNRSAGRRGLATQLGATTVLDPTSRDLNTTVLDQTRGRGADAVFVAFGSGELAAEALTLARPGGRVNLFAGFPPDTKAAIDPNIIHEREIVVTGGASSRRRDMVRAVELLSSGRLEEVQRLVTTTFPLSKIDEAFEAVRTKRALKVAIQPGGGKGPKWASSPM